MRELTNNEKLFIISNLNEIKSTLSLRDAAACKTAIIKFLKSEGFISKKEVDKLERLAFETHVLRPNVQTHRTIESFIRSKLVEMGMKHSALL